jgi:hypothetical protein
LPENSFSGNPVFQHPVLQNPTPVEETIEAHPKGQLKNGL